MSERERNSSLTREAILDAAEGLFAENGYERTSLSDVGLRAGVSRGTPGYFFGSKTELYRAVLDRCFEDVRAAVRAGRERALSSGQSPEAVLAGIVSDYFDFLVSKPNFVRLMEREALGGEVPREGVPPHIQAAQEALAAIADELALDPSRSLDPTHLLLSIMGLCWFPLAHSETLLRALGIEPGDPRFLEQRKRHVIGLVLHGIRAGSTELERVGQN